MRCRGTLESGQAGTDLSVLRRRVAGDARGTGRGDRHRRARSCARAARHPGFGAGLERCRRRQSAVRAARPSRSSTRTRSVAAAISAGPRRSSPYEEVKDAFRPESLLPLKIAESQARDLIRAWYGKQWLAPNAFKAKALTDTVKALYLPYWTFDARADARWRADSGEYYYVREGDKQVRRTKWTPVSGALTHTFDDELVCASTGVDAAKLRRIEPFPTATLVPYDPGYLAGWTVERYQIDLVTAAQHSRDAMNATLRQLCSQQVPGRHATQSRRRRDIHRPDVQTHSHARLVVDLYLPRDARTRSSSTGSPARSRVRARGAGSRSRSWC